MEVWIVQIPKLTVHEVVARRITISCRDAEGEVVPSGQPKAVILVTGIQASGKSTIAQLLAERLPQSVHVRGDLFRRMIVNGRADMTPDPASEAVRQLRLRHQLAATVSDAYFLAGFTVIVQDVILGAHLVEMTAMIRSRPLLVIVLAPQISIIADREQGRGKTAYGTWAITQLDGILRNETPRLGLWLDTSTQTPAETTDEILSRAWEEARIPRRDT
jgi:chloramphenicol 3-O-phosphotransferase